MGEVVAVAAALAVVLDRVRDGVHIGLVAQGIGVLAGVGQPVRSARLKLT